MIVRVAAGLVGLAVLLPVLLLGGVWGTMAVVTAAILVCIYEYSQMAVPEEGFMGVVWVAAGVLIPGIALVSGQYGIAIAAVSILFLGMMVQAVVRADGDHAPAYGRLSKVMMGWLWLGQVWWLVALRQQEEGLALVFMALGLAWLSDTGAYFSGRFFGKTPLHANLSPKKTVEGYAGGVGFACLGTAFFANVGVPEWGAESVAWTVVSFAGPDWSRWVHVVVIGIVVGTMGVFGDLAESLVKRATGVKDAGSIMPGHGGILDRIDSLLFVAPALCVYIYAVGTGG